MTTMVEALSFLGLRGPLACDANSCIYLNSTESMVADFETTVVQLEIADANLQSAMYEAFVNNNLIGMSPKIKNATDNLDIAEFTLRILLEILDAKL